MIQVSEIYQSLDHVVSNRFIGGARTWAFVWKQSQIQLVPYNKAHFEGPVFAIFSESILSHGLTPKQWDFLVRCILNYFERNHICQMYLKL